MAEHKTRKQMAREKRLQAVITDGCNSELLKNAEFDGGLWSRHAFVGSEL